MTGQATIRTHDVKAAAAALRRGELVAFPTETVYGLGGDATSDLAVARIFEAKGRPHFNPLIAHVAEVDEARALGVLNETAGRLADAFWPGPLTLVVPRAKGCPVSLLASAGLDTIALRVPAHPLARELLRAVARPVAAPSANPSGRLSPTTAGHVMAGLGGRIAMVLDGGPCAVGLESTIVGCLGREPMLLRPGGMPVEEIERVLGRNLELAAPGDPVSAPGQLAGHYAPRARLRLDAVTVAPGEALLAFGPRIPSHSGSFRNLTVTCDLVQAAANLFTMLHALDDEGAELIAVMPVPREGLGLAINDRLTRAAYPDPDQR